MNGKRLLCFADNVTTKKALTEGTDSYSISKFYNSFCIYVAMYVLISKVYCEKYEH